MCDQVNALDGISQDLNPISPMTPASQQLQQQPSPPQHQPTQQHQPPPQNSLPDMPMIDQNCGVPIQQNIIDPYRRTGNFTIH